MRIVKSGQVVIASPIKRKVKTQGVVLTKIPNTLVLTSAVKRVKTQGVVVTKTPKRLKLTDNGILKLKFTIVSKTEMKQYAHPMYKPLLP